MKTRIASLTILCLMLAAVPARADYNNGPINGNVDAWPFDFGFILSDSFVADNNTVTGFMLGAWEYPGDALSSVQWSITSGPDGGTLYGSGTASGKNLTDQFISSNGHGFDVDLITISGLNVAVTAGAQYWLNLANGTVPSGDPVYWDENSGLGCTSPGCPSQAYESLVGTVPSESFTINTGGQGTTPEPGSFMLLASGILGLIGVLRGKLP
jgi:hypothetical protein